MKIGYGFFFSLLEHIISLPYPTLPHPNHSLTLSCPALSLRCHILLGEDWLWFLFQSPRTHHVTIQRLLPLVNDDSGAGTTHLHPVCGAFTKNTTQAETRLRLATYLAN